MTDPTAWTRPARPAVAATAVVALIALVYGPGLQAGFVGDDFMILHRLRTLAAPADMLRFFRAEFFEYYRPLGFLSHALDWFIAGSEPRQFHLTNLLLHVANSLLVLALGWRLAPRTWAGPIAALLFGLHAASHEPVMWISARFDLLATAWSLGALLLLLHGRTRLAPAVFLLALLSKESSVALPLAALGWAVFGLRATRLDAVKLVAPWLAALAVYALARELGGGVSAIGGGARLPKLLALGAGLAGLWWLAGGRWVSVVDWIRANRSPVMAAACVALAAGAATTLIGGPAHRLVAEKFAVAGFVISNTLSPIAIHATAPFYLDPSTTTYWLGGLILLLSLVAAAPLLLRGPLEDPHLLFVAATLVATLLPISALTEGTRYLYLPLAPATLAVGLLVARMPASSRRGFVAWAVAGFVLVSGIQAAVKVRDWTWAGRMTAEGARLVDDDLAPGCGEGHVVFLTAPVAVRGVYTHFYYETFELPRGCQPGTFHVLARLMRVDGPVDVRREPSGEIVVSVHAIGAQIELSRDLRTFDIPLREAPVDVDTPLGRLRADRAGDFQRLVLSPGPEISPPDTKLYYFSDGKIHRFPL
jgi:hypothetical protein